MPASSGVKAKAFTPRHFFHTDGSDDKPIARIHLLVSEEDVMDVTGMRLSPDPHMTDDLEEDEASLPPISSPP